MGIAVKDGSTARIVRLAVHDSRTALAAYQKKGEYSGGAIEASEVAFIRVPRPLLRDAGSQIRLEGNDQTGEPLTGSEP